MNLKVLARFERALFHAYFSFLRGCFLGKGACERMRKEAGTEDLRLEPQKRLCPVYDDRSLKELGMPDEDMGFRVIDNCAEENQK